MFAGHFGLAALVKAREPQIPLAALIVSSQLLDIVFLPLQAAGVETMRAIGDGGYGEQIIRADYSHSLVGALAISAVAGLVGRRVWNARAGVVLGAVAFSHWLLDLLVHREDMALLPGNFGDLPLLGFGLWTRPGLSMAVEVGLVVVGAALYLRTLIRERAAATTADAATGRRTYSVGALVSVLLVASLLPDLMAL